MNNKKIFFSLLAVGLLATTSCSLDSISRTQAYQILKDIASSRGENFHLPVNNPISLKFNHSYYETGNLNKIQIEKYFYITKLYTSEPLIYVRHREGVGLSTTLYKEEYHYVKNNLYFAKTRSDEKSDWKCVENESTALTLFPTVHGETMAEIKQIISQFDKPTEYAEYLYSLAEENNNPDVKIQEKYRSTQLGSVTGEIVNYRQLLDGKSDLHKKTMFSYSDNLFYSYIYENYLDHDMTILRVSVDYNSYASFSVDDLTCEENFDDKDNGTSNTESEEQQ